MTPSPTFYEASGTPPAEQIVALAEPTEVQNTSYGTSAEDKEDEEDEEDEEDDVYHSGAIAPEEAVPPAELTPFELVVETAEMAEPAPAPAKRKMWPMLAFITATGVVAWAVMNFTSHPAAQKQQETQPPAVEMTLPSPERPAATTEQADKADDNFYKTLPAPAAVPEDKPADAGTGKPKAAAKPAATEERDGDIRSGRFARVKF
jgi:hypothetical protein